MGRKINKNPKYPTYCQISLAPGRIVKNILPHIRHPSKNMNGRRLNMKIIPFTKMNAAKNILVVFSSGALVGVFMRLSSFGVIFWLFYIF